MIERRASGTAPAVAALVAVLGLVAPAAGEASDFAAAFERLKSLVGTWTIASASLRGEPYEDRRTVVYSLTGNGSALVESFHGEPTMTSVYHMDLADLRLTHYCSAGNQPRMKAERWDPERSTLSFGFVDVSDLAAPNAYHTRELEVVFETPDRVQIRFEGLREGAPVPVEMTLTRRR